MADEFLTTTPATQIIFTCKPWCAGHAWRDRPGMYWVHRIGHKLRWLRNQPPAPMKYIDAVPQDRQG